MPIANAVLLLRVISIFIFHCYCHYHCHLVALLQIAIATCVPHHTFTATSSAAWEPMPGGRKTKFAKLFSSKSLLQPSTYFVVCFGWNNLYLLHCTVVIGCLEFAVYAIQLQLYFWGIFSSLLLIGVSPIWVLVHCHPQNHTSWCCICLGFSCLWELYPNVLRFIAVRPCCYWHYLT